MSWSVDKSWITRIEIVGRVGRHGNKGKILEHGDCATPGSRVKTKGAAYNWKCLMHIRIYISSKTINFKTAC
jgi:hypothetical protein